MGIPGELHGKLRNGFLDAFNEEELIRLVRDRLDERLENVIRGGTTFESKVDDLLEWAGRQGRLDELVDAAAAENPGNPPGPLAGQGLDQRRCA